MDDPSNNIRQTWGQPVRLNIFRRLFTIQIGQFRPRSVNSDNSIVVGRVIFPSLRLHQRCVESVSQHVTVTVRLHLMSVSQSNSIFHSPAAVLGLRRSTQVATAVRRRAKSTFVSSGSFFWVLTLTVLRICLRSLLYCFILLSCVGLRWLLSALNAR